ncbi:MAG TPA: hypothetical protein VLA49_01190 [Anaerolineales bacterium]|nr:hypothetical protein [Anaerolineales bacterium]
MRRVLLITPFLFVGLACLGILFTAWISASAHIQPGQILFPLQESAEELRTRLIADPTKKGNYALGLLEWRLADLTQLADTPAELAALQALDKALDRAQKISAAAPAEIKPNLMSRLLKILEQAASLLSRLSISPQEAPDFYIAVVTRVLALQDLAADNNTGAALEPSDSQAIAMLPLVIRSNGVPASDVNSNNWIDPQTVVFPPGSPGAQHAFFPLTGRHASLECTSCHTDGKFLGTARLCSTCHAQVKPANHFTGECSACHSTSAWRPASFNHSGQTNCQSCHNRPANHFSGQCSACHSTNAWRPASFNHSGQTNCQSCHNRPANHFSGQCSACHSTNAWRPASFNHSGQTDCQSCHNRPANHSSGQCSACHSTNAWRPASFNHSGQTNCQSCHNRPANHSSGQCSACHSTNAWRPASFNHSGQTDCQSCHNRPNGHYSGQCSACHSSNAWQPASFNHSGQTDCQSCHNRPNGHYSGQCSACHTSNAWQPASFNHSGQTDCQSCHNRPNGHYSGQCSACHSTNAWRPASFNHSGQTDCQSCHTRPNGHWSGQCSTCHNTSSWGGIQVRGHTFPIDHKNAGGVCSRCHNSNSPGYTCYNCHDRARMESKHAEKNIFDIANRCADCHPNGKND